MLITLLGDEPYLERAAILAIYMLAEAKTYAYAVGKESQVLLLFDDGTWSQFPRENQVFTVNDLERDYILFKTALKSVVSALSDVTVDGEAFSKIVERFNHIISTRKRERLDDQREFLRCLEDMRRDSEAR